MKNVPLAVSLLLGGLLAGCASTTPGPAPAPVHAGVPARAIARRFDMTCSYDPGENRLLLRNSTNRVLLFPGTTVAVVNGSQVKGIGRIGRREGGFALDPMDAARIESTILETSWRSSPSRVETAPKKVKAPALERHLAPAIAAGDPSWRVPLKRQWRYIVIHHSASASGNAKIFGREHRERGWDGLGYDFVIGNGHGSGDGQVEVGYRWRTQVTGAHAGRAPDGSNLMNETGIGICLVGNFDKTVPTRAQIHSLHRLIDFLEAYCRIPATHVLMHRDVRSTDCPGRKFPVREFLLPNRKVPPDFKR